MLKVGLTGGIASGKSIVAKYFAELGVPVIDSDIIAREVVKPGSLALKKIIEQFGATILRENGELNRQQLRKLIMYDQLSRKCLEDLLHPLIYAVMEKQIAQIHSPYCILVIPLLIETNHVDWVDRVLVVDLDEVQQIQRIMQRDKMDHAETKLILAAQATREQRLAVADDVIINDASLEALQKQVQQLHQKYLQLGLEKLF